jgi:hypothetical protein
VVARADCVLRLGAGTGVEACSPTSGGHRTEYALRSGLDGEGDDSTAGIGAYRCRPDQIQGINAAEDVIGA